MKKAMKSFKNGITRNIDGVVSELVKNGGETDVDLMCQVSGSIGSRVTMDLTSGPRQ